MELFLNVGQNLFVILFAILVSFSPADNGTLASPYGAFDLRMDDLLAQRSNATSKPPETQPVVAATDKPATAAAAVEAQPDPGPAKKSTGPNEMMTFKEWNTMFRQLGNDFSKFAGKKNKLSKHQQQLGYQPINYNYNFPMWNYNNQFGMMMMMQQPYSNYQMMGLNNNNWGPMQWAGGSNWYGLGWPYPHMNSYWML